MCSAGVCVYVREGGSRHSDWSRLLLTFCPGIPTRLARCSEDLPTPAPGWVRKGAPLPNRAPFPFPA
jgi:hypothetical protein